MSRGGHRRAVWATAILAALAVILAAGGSTHAQAPAAPPTLVLLANQPAFGPGAHLSVTLGLQHAGAPVTADLYFGVILPDGDSVVAFEGPGLAVRPGRVSNLASLRPMFAALTVGPGTNVVVPDFFRYTWQGHEPQGTYRLFFAATRPGALRDGRVDGGDLLAFETRGILNLARATIGTDAARAGSAEVGPAGGTVTATAADGTIYTLTVPRGALDAPTRVTLTPMTALTGLPAPVTLAAGVQGAPDGLRFLVPAQLDVELPALPAGDVFGLAVPDTGSGFDLIPVARNGTRLTLAIEHFSAVAIPVARPGLLLDFLAGVDPYWQVTQLIGAAMPGDSPATLRAVVDFMAAWYDTELSAAFPGVANPAAADEQRLAWLAEFYRWDERRAAIDFAFGSRQLDGAPIRGRLTARATEGRQIAVAVLGEGYRVWNTRCLQQAGPVPDRLRLAGRAGRYAVLVDRYFEWLETNQSSPDVDRAASPSLDTFGVAPSQIINTYCLRETIEASEPDVPPGGSGDLRAKAGVVFGTEPAAFGTFMQVRFQPDPASFANSEAEATNAQGEAFFTVTADQDGAIRYRVCAIFADELADAGIVTSIYRSPDSRCRSSVTGVVVSPSQVSISPSASQQFTVVVEGTANQAVTWAVDGGGSITQGGLFTSNGTQGTFFVRATSVEDPNSVGVAQVTVGTPPPPPPGELPCIDAACTYTGTWTRCEPGPNGTTVCANFTSILSSPQARVFPQPGQPARVGVSFTCTQSGGMSTLGGPIQPTGAFTVSQLSGSNVCILGTATGTLTAGSLAFTLIDGFNSSRVFSFSGTR